MTDTRYCVLYTTFFATTSGKLAHLIKPGKLAHLITPAYTLVHLSIQNTPGSSYQPAYATTYQPLIFLIDSGMFDRLVLSLDT